MGAGERTDGWTDTQTDMTKLTVVFRNFANVPKNSSQQGRAVTETWRLVSDAPTAPST
jgi:hypothetical protein